MSNEPEKIDISRVHLVGIGGAGMSGVARILLARGGIVTGSDAKESPVVDALRAEGAQVATQHAEENLVLSGELPTVVVTSFAAIPQDNPELVGARAREIPVIRRSDLLGELLEGNKQVLIAGTHGKTSTTSMTVVALESAGFDASFAIGGQLSSEGTNAHHGKDAIFVAEADESDASLLRYKPDIAVITNIEPDHLDFFKTPEAYFQVFEDFVSRITPGGALIICLDDEHAAALAEKVQDKAKAQGISIIGYGTKDAAKKHPTVAHTIIDAVTVDSAGTHADIAVGDSEVSIVLQIPGDHMVANAAAALSVGALLGGDLQELASGISNFSGVRRRFESHGAIESGPFIGVEVFDDYAHHPTEVRAVLEAARAKVHAQGSGNVVVVFQPHLYSRTKEFAAEFAHALDLADHVIVLDIFGAREEPMEGVTSALITDQMSTDVRSGVEFVAVPQSVADIAGPNDLVLTMGAGSVTQLADEIVGYLADSE